MALIKNPKVQLLLKMLFSALIIYLLFYFNSIDFNKIKAPLSDLSFMFVLVSLVGVALLFNSYRWMKILAIQGINAHFIPIIKYSLIGVFFNFLLPSSVGGDVVKAFLVANKWAKKKMRLLLSVLIDRVFGLVMMMIISLVGYVINYSSLSQHDEINTTIMVLAVFLVLGSFFSIGLYFNPNFNLESKLFKKINSLFLELKKFTNYKYDVFVCKLMSLGSAFCHILVFIFVFNYYGVELPLTTFMFCIPIGTVIMALPISPGGIGVGQAVFYYMFNIFGSGLGEIAFLAVTLLQVVYFIWAGLGALLFATTPVSLKEVNID